MATGVSAFILAWIKAFTFHYFCVVALQHFCAKNGVRTRENAVQGKFISNFAALLYKNGVRIFKMQCKVILTNS